MTPGVVLGAPMIKVFVSGWYDILHAGHLQFFREARALGVHWAFEPVADILYNFRNPETDVRAFGDRPARVRALAVAQVSAPMRFAMPEKAAAGATPSSGWIVPLVASQT